MDKKELRKEVRALNKIHLVGEERVQASRRICAAIESNPHFRQAKHIALYHALPDEPDLQLLLDKYAAEKYLYLPRVEGDDITFYPYSGEDSLTRGAYEIEEPTASQEQSVAPTLPELILVPGMAFTKQGIRLGRGKAYYDRFLPHTKAYLIGITFKFRIFDSIPEDEWDVHMNEIVTD